MKAVFFTLLFWLLFHGTASADSLPMIGGLNDLPVITQEEARRLAAPTGTVELLLDGLPLPYDAASDTYFISQSAQSSTFDGSLTLVRKAGYSYYLLPDAHCDKAEALSRSRGYTLYGTNGKQTDSAMLLFSALPILSITTADKALPGEEDEDYTVLYYEAQPGSLSAQNLSAEINLRGNTSKIYPKQSYRLQFVDGFGDNRHVSLAGLRTDDDWILNPMYTDASKLREPLAYLLWDMMNSSGVHAQSSRIRYVEVFFNGAYHGLYGLQERVDIKQVNGSKKTDVLYKVRTNQRPTVEELLSCPDRTACMAFEVENGDDFRGDTTLLYRPAAAYMAALSDGTLDASISVSLNNAIDYGLFVAFTQAHDSHFKNQFLNAVSLPGQTLLYKLPWDLNYTLGDVYQKELAEYNYTEYYVGGTVMDAYFEILVQKGQPHVLQAIAQRWQTLRESVLSYANLSSLAQSLDQTIYAARARDHVRWPECGRGEGNTLTYEEILTYFSHALRHMDAWCNSLVTKEQ